jgi:hypothetical protein
MMGNWISTTGYFETDRVDKGQPSVSSMPNASSTMDVMVEFSLDLLPFFGIGGGIGYINGKSNGDLGEFRHPEGSEYTSSFSYAPEFTFTLYPVHASGFFFIPLSDSLRLDFFAGLGYYFGHTQCLDDNFTLNTSSVDAGYSFFGIHFESDINTIGYHLGTSLDARVTDDISIILDVVYKVIEFKEFKSLSQLSEHSEINQYLRELDDTIVNDSTFIYSQRLGGEDFMGDIVYNADNLNLTGVRFHLGVKIHF